MTSISSSYEDLRDLMEALVHEAHVLVKLNVEDDHSATHLSVCQTLADKFELWDKNDRFPVWLSRVVEGVINDFNEGVKNV